MGAVPTKAYDLNILGRREAHVSDDGDHGWVFGVPKGISEKQWPLDPISGYPLMHGFTLLLPPDYRCHGDEITGFSFFATAMDQNDGGAEQDKAIRAAVRLKDEEAHPRMHRMQDILDYEYVVILLTAEEINGADTPVPPAATFTKGPVPEWMQDGAAKAYLSSPYEVSQIGGEVGSGIGWNRALKWEAREFDPNAGKQPREDWGEGTDSGYISYLDENNGFKVFSWAENFDSIHIGGTMQPVQSIPKFSAYYVEFEEYFGGYNFGGGGNAQLDFKDMKFDWACG